MISFYIISFLFVVVINSFTIENLKEIARIAGDPLIEYENFDDEEKENPNFVMVTYVEFAYAENSYWVVNRYVIEMNAEVKVSIGDNIYQINWNTEYDSEFLNAFFHAGYSAGTPVAGRKFQFNTIQQPEALVYSVVFSRKNMNDQCTLKNI